MSRGWGRATFVLIFAGRRHTERLAQILLVHPKDPIAACDTVVAVDDDDGLATEALHCRADGEEPGPTHRIETEVLVQVVIVKPRYRGLEDVRRRSRS